MFENSELLLKILWNSSIILSVLSIAIFTILVVFRVFTEKNEFKYQRRYRELEKMLLIHMTLPLKDLSKTFVKSPYDLAILCDISQKLLQSLKGNSWSELYSFVKETGLEEVIIKGSMSNNLKTQVAAIRLMGYLPDNKKFLNILHEKLSSSQDIRIIYACAESLASLSKEEGFLNIIEVFNKYEEISPLIIYDIIDKFNANDIFTQLKKIINSESYNQNIRIACIYCLSDIKDERAIKLFEKLHNHRDSRISSASYNAMARMDMEVPYKIIKYGSMSENWRIRLHTVNCARHSNNLPSEELLTLLSDENWIISSKAAEVLISFGDAGVRILKTISTQQATIGKRAALFLNEYEESNAA